MIVPPTNVGVLIATKPVDFRKGLPTAYQARFWASKQGSNSVWFLSMVQAT